MRSTVRRFSLLLFFLQMQDVDCEWWIHVARAVHCTAESCIMFFFSFFSFYFHVGDAFLLFCDSDCHAPFGTTHSSILSTHARTKCATETVLISAGNDFLLCSVGSCLLFGTAVREGISFSFFFPFLFFHSFSSAIKKVNQKLRSKVSEL